MPLAPPVATVQRPGEGELLHASASFNAGQRAGALVNIPRSAIWRGRGPTLVPGRTIAAS